jgi:hypothetical protein
MSYPDELLQMWSDFGNKVGDLDETQVMEKMAEHGLFKWDEDLEDWDATEKFREFLKEFAAKGHRWKMPSHR